MFLRVKIQETSSVLTTLPYSPDLAPSDYRLFPGLKKHLEVHHFSSETEVIATAETWLDGQPSDFFFFLSGLEKLEQRAKKCIEFRVCFLLLLVSFLVGLTIYQHTLVSDISTVKRIVTGAMVKGECLRLS